MLTLSTIAKVVFQAILKETLIKLAWLAFACPIITPFVIFYNEKIAAMRTAGGRVGFVFLSGASALAPVVLGGWVAHAIPEPRDATEKMIWTAKLDAISWSFMYLALSAAAVSASDTEHLLINLITVSITLILLIGLVLQLLSHNPEMSNTILARLAIPLLASFVLWIGQLIGLFAFRVELASLLSSLTNFNSLSTHLAAIPALWGRFRDALDLRAELIKQRAQIEAYVLIEKGQREDLKRFATRQNANQKALEQAAMHLAEVEEGNAKALSDASEKLAKAVKDKADSLAKAAKQSAQLEQDRVRERNDFLLQLDAARAEVTQAQNDLVSSKEELDASLTAWADERSRLYVQLTIVSIEC